MKGKHLCQSLFFNKVAGLRLWLKCFHVNSAKFLRTLFFTDHLRWLLLEILNLDCLLVLRILTGKKHPKIKLQRSQKIWIWTLGSLVHQINSFQEVLKQEKIFQKNKVVTGKTPLFVIGLFCSCHSICLNIGFWQSSFEWKWCVFNLSGFN